MYTKNMFIFFKLFRVLGEKHSPIHSVVMNALLVTEGHIHHMIHKYVYCYEGIHIAFVTYCVLKRHLSTIVFQNVQRILYVHMYVYVCVCLYWFLLLLPLQDFMWKQVFIVIVCLNVQGVCSQPHQIPFILLN